MPENARRAPTTSVRRSAAAFDVVVLVVLLWLVK
jgi:hypothetical protein